MAPAGDVALTQNVTAQLHASSPQPTPWMADGCSPSWLVSQSQQLCKPLLCTQITLRMGEKTLKVMHLLQGGKQPLRQEQCMQQHPQRLCCQCWLPVRA